MLLRERDRMNYLRQSRSNDFPGPPPSNNEIKEKGQILAAIKKSLYLTTGHNKPQPYLPWPI